MRKRNNARLRNRAPIVVTTPNPPKRDLSIPLGQQTLRFIFNADVDSKVISNTQMLNSMIVGATNTTAGYNLWTSMRLRRIQMWAPAGATPTQSPQVTLFRSSSALGVANRCMNDQNVSNDASYIDQRIRVADLEWFDTQSTVATVFVLSGATGTVLDITFDGTIAGSQAGPSATTVTTTATSSFGLIYYNALDGVANVVRPPKALRSIA